MFKVKNIIVAAACGFVLSFLISIISVHRFGVSLLRGIIFGAVFAVLSIAIDMLNSKFLEVEGDIGSESLGDSSRKTSGAGSHVNITIDDENLTEDDKAPAFDVSSVHNAFSYNNEGEAKAAPAAAAEPEIASPIAEPASEKASPADSMASANKGSAGFTPVSLGKPLEKGANIINDGSSSAGADGADSSKKDSGTAIKEIDSLPDIGEFSSIDSGSGDSGAISSVISDSEFAQSGDLNASAAMTEGGDMMKQDSKIIANAIRTLLKKDE